MNQHYLDLSEQNLFRRTCEIACDVNMGKEEVRIVTEVATWRLVLIDGQVYSVHHKNWKYSFVDPKRKANIGYHRQKDIRDKSLGKVILYIYRHDNMRKKEKVRSRQMFRDFYLTTA